MATEIPPMDDIQAALDRVGAPTDAPEVHGQLCGFLCARGEVDAETWWRESMPSVPQGNPLGAAARAELIALFDASREGLNDPLLQFPLLLPEEGASIQVRVEALGEWVGGFLVGLASGGVTDMDRLPGELSELVEDLVQLSRATDYGLSGDEEDEQAYAELVEFVRMGVLMFREELHPVKAPPKDPGGHTLH